MKVMKPLWKRQRRWPTNVPAHSASYKKAFQPSSGPKPLTPVEDMADAPGDTDARRGAGIAC